MNALDLVLDGAAWGIGPARAEAEALDWIKQAG